jgi:hypothetical protein
MAQALGIFGLLSAGAGFPGGGKPPAFGGAAVATITGAAASATSAALGGSLLGGAIGNSANDIFKHYFASDETTNNSGGNSTEPENQNRYGEDLYWEDALKNKGKIMVGGDIIPGRKPILNSKGELLSKDNSPTRGIFRAVTAAGQVIRERIASIGAYDTQKKQGIRTLNIEQRNISNIYGGNECASAMIYNHWGNMLDIEMYSKKWRLSDISMHTQEWKENIIQNKINFKSSRSLVAYIPCLHEVEEDEFISKERVIELIIKWLETDDIFADFDGAQCLAYMKEIWG